MLGRNWKHFAFILGTMTCGMQTQAQVTWSVDTTRIQWGEPLTLTAEWVLTVQDFGAGVADSAAWPAWTDTVAGGFEMLSSSPVDTLAAPSGADGDVVLRKQWQLTSWDSGFVVLPPTRFGPHETPPLLVQVMTPVLEEDATPAPPAPIVDVTWTLWERVWRSRRWWGALLLTLAMAAVCRWAVKRWKQREMPSPTTASSPPAQEPAHVVALRVLKRLLHEEGWKSGQAKEVQAQASLVVRHYLEAQFALPAAERTTGEIEALMPASAVPRAWQNRLIQALEQADAVKFAKGQLPDLTHHALLQAYIDFVLETQPLSDGES